MHRRRLILRRFGPMSIGLGAFHDGVWIDHSATATDVAALSDAERVAWDAIHSWFDCCAPADMAVPSAPTLVAVGVEPLIGRAIRSSSS